MKRILITGITGYIGSQLARRLIQKYEVYGLVREPLNLTYIRDIQAQLNLLYIDGSYQSIAVAVNASQPDIIYHLAACCSSAHGAEQIPTLIRSNIILGAYLLEAASTLGQISFIYAATIASHYENEPYRPQNLYGATKQAFSDLLAYYTDVGLIQAVTLVLSDTYGPDDHRPKILNLVKQAARAGNKIALSSGKQIYDVVYIDDVVSAFQLAGDGLLQGQFRNDVFQVVPEEPLSLRETVEKMLQVNGLTMDAGWGERPPAEREITEPIRLYPTLPGWRAKVPLEEGLKFIWRKDR